MSLVAFLAFFKYVFIMSYTPGPANLFSLNVGMHYGFKSFLKTYLGLVSGFSWFVWSVQLFRMGLFC